MRLVLSGIGRFKLGPERELFERYLARIRAIARSAGFSAVESIEIGEAHARAPEERKRQEAVALKAKLGPGPGFLIAFDEQGASVTSSALAQRIRQARDGAVPAVVLATGGPDGWDEIFRDAADLRLAFGAATLPHQLVRVLVAEQAYRALTILTGHPYHRG